MSILHIKFFKNYLKICTEHQLHLFPHLRFKLNFRLILIILAVDYLPFLWMAFVTSNLIRRVFFGSFEITQVRYKYTKDTERIHICHWTFSAIEQDFFSLISKKVNFKPKNRILLWKILRKLLSKLMLHKFICLTM